MNSAAALALKLVLTPVLVGAASLAGRRWGSAVGGWLIGIPFTSGPIVFFLALSPGPRFAATAALGTMAGAISQAAFCLVYIGWARRRLSWFPSLVGGTLAYLAMTVALDKVPLSAGPLFAVIIVLLVVSLVFAPRPDAAADEAVKFPAWDLPARMIVATVFVLVLTGLAPILGPKLAGLLAPFPLYGAVLAGFAHQAQGAASAIAVLRGLLLGLFAFAGFFLVLASLLPVSVAVAFAAAIAVAIGLQGASLVTGRRLRLA